MLTRNDVGYAVERSLDRLFEELDLQIQRSGQKPSELSALLDQASWGLGDDYREWFSEGDGEFE